MANANTRKFSFVNIVFFVIFGVLTGILWAYLCPIPLIPGVHFRTFAFIIPVIGYLFGPVTGFFSGYIGTIVWALLSGSFIALHSPLTDGITVGLSAALPALIHLKGGKVDLMRHEPALERPVRRSDDPDDQPLPLLLHWYEVYLLHPLDRHRRRRSDRADALRRHLACSAHEECADAGPLCIGRIHNHFLTA